MAFEPMSPERAALREGAAVLFRHGASPKEVSKRLDIPIQDARAWKQWADKHPVKKERPPEPALKVEAVVEPEAVAETVPVEEPPVVHHNGHGNLLAEINMAQRAAIEEEEARLRELTRLEPFIELAELIDDETKVFEETTAKIESTVAVVVAQDKPEESEPMPSRKGLAPGWFLVFAILGVALIAVLFIANGGF